MREIQILQQIYGNFAKKSCIQWREKSPSNRNAKVLKVNVCQAQDTVQKH
jgi:hypothetical protein